MGDNEDIVENIRVYIRVRPLSNKELEKCSRLTSEIITEQNLISVNKYDDVEKKSFKFNKIFGENSTQQEVYKSVGAPIVDTVLNGFNGTVFAYGQTGTGKTYTMVGSNNDDERKGIIPNAISQIFSQISLADHDKSFAITVTYLEIYNDSIRDLLSHKSDKKLVIHEHKDHGVFVKDLTSYTVTSVDAINKLFLLGNKNRIVRSTVMNDVSSRSHAVFTIVVETRDKNKDTTTVGKLNLVDLAGSERQSRTHASGDGLREAGNINLSLSVLGNVISSLVDGKCTHVPYRNSKLTRLLQDSLGGNSKTAMIATISPAEDDYEESVCTLRYAARVKHIRNRMHINTKENGLIKAFEQQIDELKAKVQLFEQQECTIKRGKRENRTREKSAQKRIIDEEIKNTEIQKEDMLSKINSIQERIIIGGENLLDKIEEQKYFIQFSNDELEYLDQSHRRLQKILEDKCETIVTIAENYSSLQEENEELDRNLEIMEKQLRETREIRDTMRSEQQFEMNRLLEDKRKLYMQMAQSDFVIQNFIPEPHLKKIECNIRWNKKQNEWTLFQFHHAGNNLKSGKRRKCKFTKKKYPETKYAYKTYEKRRRRASRYSGILYGRLFSYK